MKNLLSVSGCVALAMVSGCAAGSVSGEIDGKQVPSFSTAAFGGVEDIGENNIFALSGFSLFVGDACTGGAKILEPQADRREAEIESNLDAFNSAIEDQADAINEVIEVGDWSASLLFIGPDIDDVRDETYDLEKLDPENDPDDPGVAFAFCLQKDEASTETVNGKAVLDDGADCFAVAEGDLTFTMNPDDTTLRVFSEDEVEVQFDDGDKAGDVVVDISFSGCSEIASAVEGVLTGEG